MAVNKYLPTPDNGFSDAGSYVGSSSAAYNGPGFASLKITSKQPVMNDRTNGGLLVRRVKAYQKWELGIQYNSLSKEDHDISLLSFNGPLILFESYSDNTEA